MASLAADSDDYDWDLSVEDELLLTSLVGQQAPRDAFSPPASVSTGRRSTRSSSSKAHIGPTLAVARGVPTDEPASSLYDEKERSDFGEPVAFDPDLSFRHEARVSPREGGPAPTGDGRPLAMPVPEPTEDDDISYPDCECAS